MRISSDLEPDILAGIQQSQANLETALQQVSTGQRVNVPGDDPAASAALVQNSAESAAVDQYTANSEAALGQAQQADSVISSVVSLLNKAISVGTEGATGTETSDNRQTLAVETQQILNSIVGEANTQYQGTALFGGTSGAASAFVTDSTSSTGYTYAGSSSVNQVQVGDGLTVQTTIAGNTLFTNASGNVLGSLSQLVTALNTGTEFCHGTTCCYGLCN
jgi:flagellar hook-associated protein 3 FlgL